MRNVSRLDYPRGLAPIPDVVDCPDRLAHDVIAIPTKKTAINTKNKTDCLSHEITGTAKASARPKKQIGSDDRFSPARNVPSANKSNSIKLVVGVGMNRWGGSRSASQETALV
jgi:hypothetical protein